MKVSIIQLSTVPGDKAATIGKAVHRLNECQGSDLVVLPELWNIGFMNFDAYHREAEDKNGPTLTALTAAAKQTGAWVHAGSLVERVNEKFYNTSFLISPEGRIVSEYRKIHLFGYQSRETQLLDPGEALSVIRTPFGVIGMATCYDLRFPELFRKMVDQGTEIFIVCAAWPQVRLSHWRLLTQVRALENQCFLLAAGAAGVDHGIPYAGHSSVTDPSGQTVVQANMEEAVLQCDLDLKTVTEIRSAFPVLADRKAWCVGPRS